MCTPALRALRTHLKRANIVFACSKTVKQVLTPNLFCDDWFDVSSNPFTNALNLRMEKFDTVILFKNSFSCALAAYLSGIKHRIGYSRDLRGFLLTEKKSPLKDLQGNFLPKPMMEYYLELLELVNIQEKNTKLELCVSDEDKQKVLEKLPFLASPDSKLAILVPGGAFGPSKCWPQEYYAKLADLLAKNHGMNVVVSVAPNEADISKNICILSKNDLFDLAQSPLSMGDLKALYSNADIVICNDTGPRHIAVALDKKVVSLFGPNDPEWTNSKHKKEIMIVSDAECAPCSKPTCPKGEHICMESISVDQVYQAVKNLLETE